MDEILATIRRIIAEDERSSGTAAHGIPAAVPPADIPKDRAVGGPRETAQASAKAAGADDILNLTEALDEDGSLQRVAPLGTASGTPRAEPAPAEADSAEPKELEAKQAEPKPAEANLGVDRPAPAEASPTAERAIDPGPPLLAAQPPGANSERLVSDVAALAAATAFGRLASVPRGRREPPLVAGRPLDDIVRELLRPLLQTWLDENLPDIVERLVQAEIARISARSGPG